MLSKERIFLQVVESGSFKQAASLLGMEASSVSRKVASLEQRLGVKLLHRSTRQSTLTDLGHRYYIKLRRIVDEQTALEEDIRGGVSRLQGKLRITAPVDFGVQFVVPVVRTMQQEAPDLSVELLLGSHFANIVEQQIDVAVRIGELADSALYAKRLGDNPRVLVASPSYLAQYGTPNQLDELSHHHFVFYTPRQRHSAIAFADGYRHHVNSTQSYLVVNSAAASHQLVLEGAGIHLGPLWLFRDDIVKGRVQQLFTERPLQSFPIHAVYPDRDYLPLGVKRFMQMMSDTLQ